MPLFGRPTREDDERAAAYARWLHQRNPLAIASLVLGVFSLIEFGALLVFGVAGIILGVLALLQLRRPATATPSGHGLAWSGIALSTASLILAAVIYMLPRHPGGGGGP